jgi:hypothetical protein
MYGTLKEPHTQRREETNDKAVIPRKSREFRLVVVGFVTPNFTLFTPCLADLAPSGMPVL